MILVIDNYDSFTFNLVQYIAELYPAVEVYRNDTLTVADVAAKKPQAIVISPGPCTPKEAGISVELVRTLGPSIPVLGVCLGHQAIGYAYGGDIVRAPVLMHGKTSDVFHDGRAIFRNIPSPFVAGRYHSLVIDPPSCPDCLTVTARTADGIIMGVRHTVFPVEGIQFHPESVLTPHGKQIIANFIAERVNGAVS